MEDSTPTLGCEYILLQETGNAGGNLHDGLYTKIVGEDNLYEKNGYYLQYSKLLQAWIIKNIDVRQSCDNLQYNFYSTDANIGGLNLGDENIEFDMSFPLQTSGPEGDYSCKKPKISCLSMLYNIYTYLYFMNLYNNYIYIQIHNQAMKH